MPPPISSSPPTSRTTTTPRLPNAARATTAASQARASTPNKQTQSNGAASGQARAAAKVRGSGVEKENESRSGSTRQSTSRQSVSRASGRRTSGAGNHIRDGLKDREPKSRQVEGLKDFQLGPCLGRGAFGSVYRSLNWTTGETVAIKQIRLADMPKAELNVIMQEIDLLKHLHHPNIVKYHDSLKSADSLYIVLEYCENGSLHQICKNFGKFPENLVSLYSQQVLQGLLFLHEQGVIHRDIKGANILTTKEGLVKLADFGVATKQQGLAEGSVVGTPYWMAPEVIELAGATTASDIWSLGCTVIELLDGKPPYHKLAPMPALFRIVNDDHPPLPEGCSPLVRDFLMQCFQKDPNLRVSAKKLLKHPWIVSTRKAEKKKVTEYDEAVKSVQEWNEALKASPPNAHAGNAGSRRSSARPGSRPGSRSTAKASNGAMPSTATKGVPKLAARRTPTQGYQSPDDEDKRNNWDADFDSLSTSLAGLKLPDHLKPQDNFAGLFSSDKLKQYASFDSMPEMDGKVEAWDEEFEGDLTVRSPLQLSKGSALETVRPFYPPRATSWEIKNNPPPTFGSRRRSKDERQQERKASKESQPRTQILRPAMNKADSSSSVKQTPPQQSKRPAQAAATTRDMYKEEDEEDYSDLVADDDDAFKKKLAAFSPGRPYNPSDIRNIQNKLGGSVRRRTRTPTSLVHDAAAMRRTRSSLEIQKYAEDAEDEDFTDLHFGEDDTAGPMDLRPVKTRSPKSVSASSESERGGARSASWVLDEEEEEDDDPFAFLEEELDQVDLESNVARDKHARLCTLVEGLVSDLKLGQLDDVLAEIVDQLLQILEESPDVRTVIVSSHGMLPILEILETCTRTQTILQLLKIVNCIISDSVEVQENLCFVGGIPILSKFAHKKYASEIRLEAAAFVRMMYQTSTLTLQMFVSCGGLNVLVEFLEEEYESDIGRELVLIGVNGVWSVFELQGPTPKNDFCRIFSRSSVLYPLSLVLNRVLDEEGEQADEIEGRIVNIFLLFSQAENHVKETVADRMVLKRVLKDLRRMSPQHQITMLKFIKNLSMLATTLDALQNSNAIEVLTDLLGASMHALHFREISNQVLNTMYNLCRLSKARQEDAALSGVIPLLQRIVQTERPLKEFALPIICDMAHSGKVGRKILWQNKGLAFYVSLLADQYWAVTALDAIFVWLQEETAKVEESLLRETMSFASAVERAFCDGKADAFENLLEPLQKLLRLSPPVAASLARAPLFERCAVKVHAKKPLVRLNLLRIVRSICDASDEEGALLRRYGLLSSVEELARHDPAILVREMASDLVRSAEMGAMLPQQMGMAMKNRYPAGLRRSSSSMATPPPGPLLPSAGSTPSAERAAAVGAGGRGSSYFDLNAGMEMVSSSQRNRGGGMSSPYRPVSRDGNSSGSTSSLAAAKDYTSNNTSHGPSSAAAIARSSSRASLAGLPSSTSNLVPPGPAAAGASRNPSRRAQSRLSLAPLSTSSSSAAWNGTAGVNKVSETLTTPTHAPPSANTRSSAAGGTAPARDQARKRRQTSGGEMMGRGV